MSDSHYCYPPDFRVLRNKLNLKSAKELDYFEREFVTARAMQDLPQGDFDLAHLRAIHRHLFQDVYDWAGEIRVVEISKGGSQFQARRFIEQGMGDVHRRIKTHNYLRNLPADQFADLAGEIMGDVNYVHPFREGNGRTQLFYLDQLAAQAGHALDLDRVRQLSWMQASRDAHMGDYKPMASCIYAMIDGASHAHEDHDHEHGD